MVSNEDYLRSGQIDWEVCRVQWRVPGRGVTDEGIRAMSQSTTRITLSAKGLIMKIVGDVLIIETSDTDELRREVNRALDDEPLTVQGAAGYLKVSTRTIRNWIKSGKLPAQQFDGAGFRIRKLDLERVADRDI